jgi:predicted nucleotidyltransferase
VASGILANRREGARAYFKAETRSPVFRELQQLFEKTAGLAPMLEQMLEPFGNKIQSAYIYGSVARSRDHAMSDVDVMVIGRAGIADLSPALRKAEERLGREVNVTAYSPQELREKIKSREHFPAAVTLTSFQKLFPSSQLFRKPVGESEIRSTTPSPTLRRRRSEASEIGNSQNYHLVPNLSDEGRLGVVLSCSRKNGRF